MESIRKLPCLAKALIAVWHINLGSLPPVGCSAPPQHTQPCQAELQVSAGRGFGLTLVSVEPRNVVKSNECSDAGLGPPGKRSILESLWWDRAAVPELSP